MNITDIRVRVLKRESRLRAVASVTIDNVLVIHDIKVIEGDKGWFIAMPSRRTQEGEYRDVVHPLNTETRQELQNLIVEKYNEAVLAEEENEE